MKYLLLLIVGCVIFLLLRDKYMNLKLKTLEENMLNVVKSVSLLKKLDQMESSEKQKSSNTITEQALPELEEVETDQKKNPEDESYEDDADSRYETGDLSSYQIGEKEFPTNIVSLIQNHLHRTSQENEHCIEEISDDDDDDAEDRGNVELEKINASYEEFKTTTKSDSGFPSGEQIAESDQPIEIDPDEEAPPPP